MSWATATYDPCPIEDSEMDGPLILKPQVGRVVVAILLLLFGFLFTAFSFVMFYFVMLSKFWLGLICPFSFLLFSLAIDIIAFKHLLKCFNPKPTVVLSQRNLYPGAELEISWMFQGQTRRIHQLQVRLIGRESTSFQVGTDTKRFESNFYDQKIFDSEDPEEIAKGFVVVQLPSDAMHSFKTKYSEILWLVQLTGKIKAWPDLDDIYPIRILTLPKEELAHG